MTAPLDPTDEERAAFDATWEGILTPEEIEAADAEYAEMIDPTDPLHTPTDEPPHICTYTTDAQGVRSCQVCRRIEDKGER